MTEHKGGTGGKENKGHREVGNSHGQTRPARKNENTISFDKPTPPPKPNTTKK